MSRLYPPCLILRPTKIPRESGWLGSEIRSCKYCRCALSYETRSIDRGVKSPLSRKVGKECTAVIPKLGPDTLCGLWVKSLFTIFTSFRRLVLCWNHYLYVRALDVIGIAPEVHTLLRPYSALFSLQTNSRPWESRGGSDQKYLAEAPCKQFQLSNFQGMHP